MMTMCWRNLLLVSSSQISSFSSSTTLSSFTTFHCSMVLLIMVVLKMMRMVVLVTMVVIERRWKRRPWTIFTVLVVSSELFSALSTPVQIISAWKHRQDEFESDIWHQRSRPPDSTLIRRIRTSDLTKSNPSSSWPACSHIVLQLNFLGKLILPPACQGSLPGSESASAKAQTSPQASCSDEPSLPATSHCLALSCRNMPCHHSLWDGACEEKVHLSSSFSFDFNWPSCWSRVAW